MKKITIIFVLIILCVYPVFADENVYSWTDDKGVKHFGNQKPHDGIKYDKTKAIKSSTESERIRPGYTALVEDAKNLVRQHKLEVDQEKIRRAEEEKQKAEKEKLEKKIAELSDKIKEIENRPVVYYPVKPVIGRGHVQVHKQGYQRNANAPEDRHTKRQNTAEQKEPRK
ncbi:MAG: DUF4124 domain-containing protein [Proteobacteria bacterium]|nr:DUF4124 domain-containing protein [Pseudomonadota bacterium]